MPDRRVWILALGIPGLLLYATLGVAQWRSASSMSEFTRLQKAYPPDSLKKASAKIDQDKLNTLAQAQRLAPDNPEIAYQTALYHLVHAETQSLQPTTSSKGDEEAPDPRLTFSLKEGLVWINRSIVLNPGFADYYFLKATLIQNLSGTPGGEDEDSPTPKAVAALLHLADRMDPFKPSLHFRMGSFWVALGNNAGARNAFTVALADSILYARPVFELLWSTVNDVGDLEDFVGDSPLVRALLTTFLLDHGYSKEAESGFAGIMSQKHLDYPTVEIMADYALRTGKPAAVRTILEKIDANSGVLNLLQQAHLQYLRGQSFFSEGRLQESITCFEAAIRLGTEDTYIHEALGNAYQQTGDYDRAIARYLLVLQRDRGVMEAKKMSNLHVELATAYEKKQDFPRAIEHYFKAAQVDPTNIAAQRRASELSSQHL